MVVAQRAGPALYRRYIINDNKHKPLWHSAWCRCYATHIKTNHWRARVPAHLRAQARRALHVYEDVEVKVKKEAGQAAITIAGPPAYAGGPFLKHTTKDTKT